MSNYEKAQVLQMLADGISPNKVARVLGLNIHSVLDLRILPEAVCGWNHGQQ